MASELGPIVRSKVIPGRMTAVMRALSPGGPRVLRVGLARGGRLLEERILGACAEVTIGSDEKNTFVVSGGTPPATFRVLSPAGGDYDLCFHASMDGRVALPSGITELSSLKDAEHEWRPFVYRVRLDRRSRGKVTLGEVTLLFQFVAPPPAQPRAQLPVAVTRGSASVDWRTTMIAAGSFLAHFFLIGSAYSEWLDPVADYDASVGALLDALPRVAPPEVEQPDVPEPHATEAHRFSDAPDRAQSTRAVSARRPENAHPEGRAALDGSLRTIMEAIGVIRGGGPVTDGVLRGSEVPTTVMDTAARAAGGVGSGFQLGGGPSTVHPGPGNGRFDTIGSTVATDCGKLGVAEGTSGPRGSVPPLSVSTVGAQVTDAARVVAGLRAGFRRCYERALAQSPDAQGRIALSFRVGPGGEVQSVVPTVSGPLPDSVVSCVRQRAASALFAPPQGGGQAVIQVPVSFVKQ